MVKTTLDRFLWKFSCFAAVKKLCK